LSEKLCPSLFVIRDPEKMLDFLLSVHSFRINKLLLLVSARIKRPPDSAHSLQQLRCFAIARLSPASARACLSYSVVNVQFLRSFAIFETLVFKNGKLLLAIYFRFQFRFLVRLYSYDYSVLPFLIQLFAITDRRFPLRTFPIVPLKGMLSTN